MWRCLVIINPNVELKHCPLPNAEDPLSQAGYANISSTDATSDTHVTRYSTISVRITGTRVPPPVERTTDEPGIFQHSYVHNAITLRYPVLSRLKEYVFTWWPNHVDKDRQAQ